MPSYETDSYEVRSYEALTPFELSSSGTTLPKDNPPGPAKSLLINVSLEGSTGKQLLFKFLFEAPVSKEALTANLPVWLPLQRRYIPVHSPLSTQPTHSTR